MPDVGGGGAAEMAPAKLPEDVAHTLPVLTRKRLRAGGDPRVTPAAGVGGGPAEMASAKLVDQVAPTLPVLTRKRLRAGGNPQLIPAAGVSSGAAETASANLLELVAPILQVRTRKHHRAGGNPPPVPAAGVGGGGRTAEMTSTKLLEQAASTPRLSALQRNLEQLEVLYDKFKGKTLHAEAPFQSLSTTSLLGQEEMGAEQLTLGINSLQLEMNQDMDLLSSKLQAHTEIPTQPLFTTTTRLLGNDEISTEELSLGLKALQLENQDHLDLFSSRIKAHAEVTMHSLSTTSFLGEDGVGQLSLGLKALQLERCRDHLDVVSSNIKAHAEVTLDSLSTTSLLGDDSINTDKLSLGLKALQLKCLGKKQNHSKRKIDGSREFKYTDAQLVKFLMDWVSEGKISSIKEMDLYECDVEELPLGVSAFLVNLQTEKNRPDRISRIVRKKFQDGMKRKWHTSIQRVKEDADWTYYSYYKGKTQVKGINMGEFRLKSLSKLKALCKVVVDERFVPNDSRSSVFDGEHRQTRRKTRRLNCNDLGAKEMLSSCNDMSHEILSMKDTMLQLRKEKGLLEEACITKNEVIAELEKENKILKDELDQSIKELLKARETFNTQIVELEKKRIEELHKAEEGFNAQINELKMKEKVLQEKILDLKGKIRVFCRVRPSRNEKRAVECITAEGSVVLQLREQKHIFQYNKVFAEDAKQSEIFEEMCPVILSAMEGHKVCVFAYGQSGAGKTHTMLGNLDPKDETQRGLIPRSIDLVIKTSKDRKLENWVYQIKASVLEIHNENIQDLLSSKPSEVMIKHDRNNKPVFTGLSSKDVQELDETVILVKSAIEKRSVGKTKINDESSRSHCVFMVNIFGENKMTGERLRGLINLVDLAGSENISQSGVEGDLETEAKFINKSLSAVKDVVSALGNKRTHVPFRNSKLTHFLMSSLSDGAKIVTIINICPEESSAEQTISSLRFGLEVSSVEMIGQPTLKVGSPQYSRVRKMP